MSVTPTSYQALAVANALTMLARSATLQAAASVGSEASARGVIINSHGGAPPASGGIGKALASDGSTIDLETGVYAEIGLGSLVPTIAGVGYWDRDGNIGIRIVIPRVLPGESPADNATRAHNVIGGICADIEALFGADGCLAQGAAEPAGIDLSDETGADQNHTTGYISVSFLG